MPVEVAQCWSTGPVLLYCNAPVNGAEFLTSEPVFLGTGERAPVITEVRKYRPIKSDFGTIGRTYLETTANVEVLLTRWNEVALSYLQRSPTRGVNRGADGPGDVGFSYGLQTALCHLWLYFPSVVEKADIYGLHPPGYHFGCVTLDGPVRRKGGTGPNWTFLIFEAVRTRDPFTGQLILYDHDMTPVQNLGIT